MTCHSRLVADSDLLLPYVCSCSCDLHRVAALPTPKRRGPEKSVCVDVTEYSGPWFGLILKHEMR